MRGRHRCTGEHLSCVAAAANVRREDVVPGSEDIDAWTVIAVTRLRVKNVGGADSDDRLRTRRTLRRGERRGVACGRGDVHASVDSLCHSLSMSIVQISRHSAIDTYVGDCSVQHVTGTEVERDSTDAGTVSNIGGLLSNPVYGSNAIDDTRSVRVRGYRSKVTLRVGYR